MAKPMNRELFVLIEDYDWGYYTLNLQEQLFIERPLTIQDELFLFNMSMWIQHYR